MGYIFLYTKADNKYKQVPVFSNISETMGSTNMYYISLERSFHSISAHFTCKNIHVEMTGKS